MWSRLLPRYVAGTLPPFLARRVQAAIDRDLDLAAAYDSLRRAERRASGRSLSTAQKDRIEAALFASPSPAAARSPMLRLLPAFAAVAAAVCFVVVRAPEEKYGVGDLASRGVKISSAPVGVKVTCLDAKGAQVLGSATAGARRAMDVLTCPQSSLLAFSTTNLGKETRHVFVVGVAADGSRRWYAPFSPGAASVAVAPGVVDDVLSSVADTSGMVAGPVSLYVLVSDQPFSADDVEHALARGQKSGVPLGHLDRLPVDFVPLQARIDVRP
jgi:hypothetical protein